MPLLRDIFKGAEKEISKGPSVPAGVAAGAALAGGIGTPDDANALPLSKASKLAKAAAKGVSGIWKIEGTRTKSGSFSYAIKKGKENIGEVQGKVTGDVAYIDWIGSDAQLSREGLRALSQKFLKEFPDVKWATGHRISGAHGNKVNELRAAMHAAEAAGNVDEALRLNKELKKYGMQRVRLAEAGAGLAAPLALAGANIDKDAFKEDRGSYMRSLLSIGKDVARLPADLLSFGITGQPVEGAIETGKNLVQEGVKQVARLNPLPQESASGSQGAVQGATQVAEALKPGEPPPQDAVPFEPPQGAERVGEAHRPSGFWDRISSRFMGTDVEDPQPMTRLGTMVTSGIAGGVMGSKVPGNPAMRGAATLIGGAAGTFAGAVAPEATMEFLEKAGAVEPGYRNKHGLTSQDLRTLAEGEVLIDVATAGGLSTLRGISRGTARLLAGPTKGGRRLAEDAAREGIALMPVQVGDRYIGRGFVNVMGRFPLIAGPLRKVGKEGAKRLQEAYTRLPERIAPVATMSDTHLKVLSEVEGLVTKLNDTYVKQFDEVLTRPGVSVEMKNSANAIQDMVDDVGALIPSPGPVKGGKPQQVKLPGRVAELKSFLDNTLLPIAREGEAAPQTLKQADSLLNAIDDKIAGFAKKGDVEAVSMLDRVRQSVQSDMLTNLKGARAAETATDLKNLSAEWSRATEELFSNAVAKRMGVSKAQGFRAAKFAGSRDQISDTIGLVLRSEDPAMIGDLQRVLSPKAFRELTSSVMADRVRDAFVRLPDGKMQLHAGKFAKALGLDAPESGRYLQTKALLEKAGGQLKMKDLQKLDDIAKAVEGIDIPDVSTFVARRGTIGGFKSIIGSVIPTMAAGGGAAGAAARGPVKAAVTGMMLILGARGISRAIANPANARLLRNVLDEEAKDAVRLAQTNRLTRIIINGLESSLDTTPDVADRMRGLWDAWKAEVEDEVKRNREKK